MRWAFFCLIALFFYTSCHISSVESQKQADSLLYVLKFQIHTLAHLSKYSKDSIRVKDSLNRCDSILMTNILYNYYQSLLVMDSIGLSIPKIISEADTLFKYTYSKDTLVLNRFNYLIHLNQKYLNEYFRASSIYEQNKALLQLKRSH